MLFKFFDLFNSENKNIPFVIFLKNIAPFPLLMYLGLPILIFASLFYIPENYAGIFPFSQSMPGTYQNKWLFDMLGLYNIVFSIVCMLKYFIVGMPNHVEETLRQFHEKSRCNSGYQQIVKYINFFMLLFFIIQLFWISIITFAKISVSGILYLGRVHITMDTWQDSVFTNFFWYSLFVCLPIVVSNCVIIFFLVLRKEVKRNDV